MQKQTIEPNFPLEIEGYDYLGRGPAASSGGIGWKVAPDIYYRCVSCGDLITLHAAENGGCSCGKLDVDTDYGRFSAFFGDHNVLVYQRKTQK